MAVIFGGSGGVSRDDSEAQVIQLENEARALSARADRISAQINNYVATVNTRSDPSSQYVTNGKALEAEAVDTLGALNDFNGQSNVVYLRAYGDPGSQQRMNDALDIIRQARSRTDSALLDVRSTLATVGTAEPDPEVGTNSAGDIIGEDADNRTEQSTTQNPPTGPEQGGLAVETQSNAEEDQFRSTALEDGTTRNAQSEDTGAADQTAGTTILSTGEIRVSKGYLAETKPKENVLSQFASSTYSVTIYMLRPEEYNTLLGYSADANTTDINTAELAQDTKKVEGFNAILASGGLPNGGLDNLTGDPYTTGGAIRNRYFDLDYFIDDIQIDTLLPKQVRGASNATNLSFKVTEPYGFTFLNRLKLASEDLNGSLGGKDWIKQHYLMVIRFYGYKDDGSLSTDEENVLGDEPVESKFIPFKFTNITTRAATGAVEYMCQAVPINHYEAMSQKRASIKYQVEINGQTLENLFNGKLSQTAEGTDGRVVSTGLVESINNYYKKLANDGVIDIADQYEVIFDPEIGKQKIIPPGSTKKNRTPMADPGSFNPALQSMKKNSYTMSVNAGTQFQHFIDQAVRTSEWITKQQTKYIDPNTRKPVTRTSNNLLQWYKVLSSVKQLEYDNKRKDYAYKITYYVVRSGVGDVKSAFFPKKPFNGCQKRYKYWFTGENTEILDYEVDFNALYYVSSSPDIPITESDKTDIGTVGETSSPGPADQSIQGGADLSGDPAARAASVLYSPTDYATLNLKILGDPFYIQQGDIFFRSISGPLDNNPGFLADGSADYDSGEVLLEVDYNTIEDYDEVTGEAKPRPIELKSQEETARTVTDSGIQYKGLIYQVTQVTNNFSKGVFTQDIQGVLRQYLSGDPKGKQTTEEVKTSTSNVYGSVDLRSQEVVIPPILVKQEKTSSTTSTTRSVPTAFGSNQAPVYVAPDEDAG